MKIHELYASVAELGFVDSLEDIPAFYAAANRALLQINALRPLTAILDIYHRRPENLIHGANHNIIEHVGKDIIFPASDIAKGYYFEVLGEGECRVEAYNTSSSDWDVIKQIEFSKKTFTAIRGFIKRDGEFTTDEVRLRFIGEYAYQIRNVALWGVVYSSDETEVPAYEEHARYDLRKLDPSFIELCDNPFLSSFTRLTEDYYFESNSVIILPANEAREIKIKYKRAPSSLVYTESPEEDDTAIELDPELVQLMPLLVSAYVWIDEGDGKSQYYLDLYYRRAAEIEAKNRSREGAKYANVTGW